MLSRRCIHNFTMKRICNLFQVHLADQVLTETLLPLKKLKDAALWNITDFLFMTVSYNDTVNFPALQMVTDIFYRSALICVQYMTFDQYMILFHCNPPYALNIPFCREIYTKKPEHAQVFLWIRFFLQPMLSDDDDAS